MLKGWLGGLLVLTPPRGWGSESTTILTALAEELSIEAKKVSVEGSFFSGDLAV
ncbi:MAG: hypothetical protein F7C33_04410 [Desulfurococcales archaeon]|nr:hypothetical protein [Desulfurococcales archaeon]